MSARGRVLVAYRLWGMNRTVGLLPRIHSWWWSFRLMSYGADFES